jgi:hypothetical protein
MVTGGALSSRIGTASCAKDCFFVPKKKHTSGRDLDAFLQSGSDEAEPLNLAVCNGAIQNI